MQNVINNIILHRYIHQIRGHRGHRAAAYVKRPSIIHSVMSLTQLLVAPLRPCHLVCEYQRLDIEHNYQRSRS